MKRSFIFLFLLLSVTAQAQRSKKLSPEQIARLHATEDTLAVLAYAVVNDSIEQSRYLGCMALIKGLVSALKTENSFQYPFDRLKSLSILAPPDSSFRIFTWQLFVNDSTYRYYGTIQVNSRKLELFPLIDRSFDMKDLPTEDTLRPDKWYGALYYGLRQFDTKNGRKYLLIGYDAYSFFTKRKVIDVLSFDKSGKPYFGARVFERGQNLSSEHRLFFEYGADASVRVNWDEQYGMILFDHLIPLSSPYGQGAMNVPDGSYDGLKLEKGRWKYIVKVFNDVQEEAPFPEPILDARKGKDIEGRPKKARN